MLHCYWLYVVQLGESLHAMAVWEEAWQLPACSTLSGEVVPDVVGLPPEAASAAPYIY
jgi:hypothetical protein